MGGAIDVRNDMSGDEKMSWVEVKKVRNKLTKIERKRWKEEEKERKKERWMKLNEK